LNNNSNNESNKNDSFYKNHQTGTNSTHFASFEDQQQYYKHSIKIADAIHSNNNIYSDLKKIGGPNLVNKQLVLPFIPPAFPNGVANESNHLIKPSEYLKSISSDNTRVHSSNSTR
jgi:hypothetical protein